MWIWFNVILTEVSTWWLNQVNGNLRRDSSLKPINGVLALTSLAIAKALLKHKLIHQTKTSLGTR